ncbi:LPXTG cell wall anchor domain-containing protein [Streptomyces sp. NPDC006552]|uniref:LPXTG cell wall anchor domain-containing protein n=1 Tax=Streptomyces sp. NPDC006552 TaxID=3157179 RepID=UPI0033B74C3B
MKLRRALVTVAATAALAPAALLCAPAAFADGTPAAASATGDPSAGTSTEPGDGAAGTEPPATGDDTTTPAPADTTPGTADTTPAPDPDETTTPPASPDPSVTDGTDETEPPGDETGGEPGDETGGDECTAYEDSPGTLAELRGLPSQIVAGSGWHGFTFRVSNKTDEAFTSVTADLYAFAYAYDEDITEITKYLHVQYSDRSGWHDLDTDVSAQDALAFGDAGAIAPGHHADVRLRIKVDAQAPTGTGGSVAFAASVNTDGVCGYNVPGDKEYRFEILAADAKPGKVPPATSAPRPANTPAPQASSTPLAGTLAETGSSSMLPAAGVAGALAVLAGAGVVYSVRRREADDRA